ncbi:MAG: NfeD family protein [Candidatus Thermoplasmatota archaeon]
MVLIPIFYIMYMQISSPDTPTTTDKTMKGRKGHVVKEIKPDNISGKVKVMHSSQIWSAIGDREIEKEREVKISDVDGVHLKVEETIEEGELIELEKDINEYGTCPSCDTVLTVYTKECPVCGEGLETNKDRDKGGFLKSFVGNGGSLRS